jgi:hypothetical protein
VDELDLILRADSLTELSKLVFATRRVGVILAAILWLVLNIAAQGSYPPITFPQFHIVTGEAPTRAPFYPYFGTP